MEAPKEIEKNEQKTGNRSADQARNEVCLPADAASMTVSPNIHMTWSSIKQAWNDLVKAGE